MRAYGLRFDSWCEICVSKWKTNGCDGCQPNPDDPIHNKPSKFYHPIELEKEKEKKNMIITIIGSYSKKEKMLEAKKYFERFGHEVNCPCDPGREKMALIEKQTEWIKMIEKADMIVVIPKSLSLEVGGRASYVMEFGEATSYEMAIALSKNKQIVIW